MDPLHINHDEQRIQEAKDKYHGSEVIAIGIYEGQYSAVLLETTEGEHALLIQGPDQAYLAPEFEAIRKSTGEVLPYRPGIHGSVFEEREPGTVPGLTVKPGQFYNKDKRND